MSAEYVRSHYPVDYRRGERLVFQAGTPQEQRGVLVSFPGQYLGVRFDGERHTTRLHPMWRVTREEQDR
jgi:hypothetical protein